MRARELLLFCSFLGLGASGAARAALTLDQSQTTHSGGENNLNYIDKFAQTFTVGVAGDLVAIDLWGVAYGTEPDVTVSITPVLADGRPDDTIILATATLRPPALTLGLRGVLHFDLSATPVPVTPGQQLAIVITSTDIPWQTGDLVVLNWGSASADYPGGGEYRSWDGNTGQACNWCGGTRDIWFRTWVETEPVRPPDPEPPQPDPALALAEREVIRALENLFVMERRDVLAPGHRVALQNFLEQALAAIDLGDVPETIDRLLHAAERTDGCILRGSVDRNGPGRDFVTDCAAQQTLFLPIMAALDALRG